MNSPVASVMVLKRAVAIQAIVLDFERHGAGVRGDQAAIGDGDTVRVAREIGEHRLRSGEGSFRINHPFGALKGPKKSSKGLSLGKRGMLGEEPEPAFFVGFEKHGKDKTPEQPRENPHGQQEVRPAGDPLCAILGQPAARHDHVNVRMVRHGRAPSVQDRRDADPGAERLGIDRNRQCGLGRRLEQDVAEDRLVRIGKAGDRPGKV